MLNRELFLGNSATVLQPNSASPKPGKRRRATLIIFDMSSVVSKYTTPVYRASLALHWLPALHIALRWLPVALHWLPQLGSSSQGLQIRSRIATRSTALAPCPQYSPALAPTTRFFISRTPNRK